jgi:hypothetical protein
LRQGALVRRGFLGDGFWGITHLLQGLPKSPLPFRGGEGGGVCPRCVNL